MEYLYSQTPVWQQTRFDELTRKTSFSKLADIKYTWSLPSPFSWQGGGGPRTEAWPAKKQAGRILLFVCLGPVSFYFTKNCKLYVLKYNDISMIKGTASEKSTYLTYLLYSNSSERADTCNWKDFRGLGTSAQRNNKRHRTNRHRLQIPTSWKLQTHCSVNDGAEQPTLSKHPESQQTPRFHSILPVKSSLTCGKTLFWDNEHNMTALIEVEDKNERCHLMHHLWIWIHSFWCYGIKHRISTGPSLSCGVSVLINLCK